MKFLRIILLLPACMLVSFDTKDAQAIDSAPCLVSNGNEYGWRGNRCEGIVPQTPINTGFGLISFSSGYIRERRGAYRFSVPIIRGAVEPIVVVQSPFSGYKLDNLKPVQRAGAFQYKWPSAVIKRVKTNTDNMLYLASIEINSQLAYLPVLFPNRSKKYQFIIYSSLPARISVYSFIQKSTGKVINRKSEGSTELRTDENGQIRLEFKNSHLPKGLYILRIVATQFRIQKRHDLDLQISFMHDPKW